MLWHSLIVCSQLHDGGGTPGYCDTTDEHAEQGCSATRRKGTFTDTPNRSACFALCGGCERCHFVSYSRQDQDCSWFRSCPRIYRLSTANGTDDLYRSRRVSIF